jgi:hypothetical protein
VERLSNIRFGAKTIRSISKPGTLPTLLDFLNHNSNRFLKLCGGRFDYNHGMAKTLA